MSVPKKISLCALLLLVPLIGFFSWEYFEADRDQIREDQRGKIELLTEIINNRLKTVMLEGRGEEFQRLLETFVSEDIAAVRIFTENGTILTSSVPGEVGKKYPRKALPVPRIQDQESMFSVDQDGHTIYTKVFLIRNDMLCQQCHDRKEHIRGILDVEISSLDADRKIAAAGRRIGTHALILGILLSAGLGLIGLYLVKMPLESIMTSLRKFREGDLSERVPAGGKDEMGRLGAQINELLAELERTRADIVTCRRDKDQNIERMASLGELAAAVAHDIKNPLAGISGALQVLAEDYADDNPRKEIASEILDEISRLDMAVKDLLIFARPPELHLILVDINAIIEKVIGMVRGHAEQRGIKIRSSAGNLPKVMADPDQIEKALLHISRYCMQSMQSEGVLSFETEDMQTMNELRITVSDTGKGIGQDQLKGIFKPSFSTKNTGTGLGLAISRNVIENHRGRIEVKSSLGTGTAFHIMLPRKG